MNYEYDMKARGGAGIATGMLAGAVMAMVAMVRAWTLGMGFWLPPKLIAGLFYGVDALIGGAGVVIVGLVIHMIVSGGLGMAFGMVYGHQRNAVVAMIAGIGVGIAAWAAMTWLVLPWANPVMLERQMVAPGWWFGYHLIYGAMLFATPWLTRAFGVHPEPRVAREREVGAQVA